MFNFHVLFEIINAQIRTINIQYIIIKIKFTEI